MRRIMVLMLLMIFSLGKKDIRSDISENLGIDVGKGTVNTDSDSHGGFHASFKTA